MLRKKKQRSILLTVLLAVMLLTGCVPTGKTSETGTMHMNLRGDREVYIECNSPYVEGGAYAAYTADGTTQKLQVEITGDTVDTGKLGTYFMKYTAWYGDRVVTDYRRVHVVDTEKPTIQLLGAQVYTMSVGQPYAELGCQASDNYDGDLSTQVQVLGTVDRMTPGEYELTYLVTDSYKNTSSVTRIVRVEEWVADNIDIPVYGKPNGKVIYLTFDDGPGEHTPRLLDILKKFNVKATFFVVGTGHLDVVKRIAAEGHTLALHANSHTYQTIYASEEAYFADLSTIRGKVQKLTGQEPTIIRFPGGSSNKVSRFNPGIMTRLSKLVEEKGYRYFDWNVDSKDAGGAKTPEEVFYNVMSGIQNSSKEHFVVLQHDIKSYSVDAVEQIIRWGLANGYTFLPMDENTPACKHTVRN